MTINLTDKDLKDLRRLGNALSSGNIPVNVLQGFISGLQKKVVAPASTPARRVGVKESRKESLRKKLHRI